MKNILRVIFILIFSFNFVMAINAYFSNINGTKIVESFIPESNVDFNISMDSNITNEVNLTCEFIDINTSSDDFTHGNVTISFEVNQTYATLPLTITSDSIYEDNEIFTMRLKDNNNTLLHEINVTINNNDPLPIISIANKSFGECNGTSKIYTFPITINNKIDRNISFDINSTEASADSLDFNSTNQTFTIEPSEWISNSITKDLNVTILCDNIYERNESFNLKVSNITNASSTQNEANITIIEDDPIPTISVTPIASSVMESNAILTFDFNLSHLSKFDINISLDLNKTQSWFLTANEGSDYTLSTKNINFPSGTDKAELNISIIDDNYYEFNESVRFDLNLTGEANSTRDYIQVNIYQDNDPEFIITQSLKDGTNLSNIFVTDMVTFKVGVTNNSDYNMSNIEIWDDLSISFERNGTYLSTNEDFNTSKVIGQANGYMFNILSLQKDETKYLYIDVNVTEPVSPKLTNDKIKYSNENMDNNHSDFDSSSDVYRISEFSNNVSVDTNFTDTGVNYEYLDYTPLSSPYNEANTTFYAKQYLMDIEVIKKAPNFTKNYLEFGDSVAFDINITNLYPLTKKIPKGLLLYENISDALDLPSSINGFNGTNSYYIVDLSSINNTLELNFNSNVKNDNSIVGLHNKQINCAMVFTTYNKKFYDVNVTNDSDYKKDNNKDCVELDENFLIKSTTNSELVTINGFEFDECELGDRHGTSSGYSHIDSFIGSGAIYSTGKPALNDGEGGKYCFGAKMDNDNSYITVNDVLNDGNATFDTISKFTITNWFYPTNLSTNSELVILSRENSYYLTIKETGGNDDKLNFYIHKNNFSTSTIESMDSNISSSSGTLGKDGDYYIFRFDTTINPNSWYYLGFLYDGTINSNSNTNANNTYFNNATEYLDYLQALLDSVGKGENVNDYCITQYSETDYANKHFSSDNTEYIYCKNDNSKSLKFKDCDTNEPNVNSFKYDKANVSCLFNSGNSQDAMQLYLVQENGELNASTNPYANFLPKELNNSTSDFYMYKNFNGLEGVRGYAENIEIYYNEANNTTITDNFDIYNDPTNPNYKNDHNKTECRLCGNSNASNYSKIFDENVTGSSTIIGASILKNSSNDIRNDSANMTIDNANSQDTLNLGEKLELPNSSEILFAKLYWQGAILDTNYIKELYSPDRNISAYKSINFSANNNLKSLNSNDINCSWLIPNKYIYLPAQPVTYNCYQNKWFSPTGNTNEGSSDRVCLTYMIKKEASEAGGKTKVISSDGALYYQCSVDVTSIVSGYENSSNNPTIYKVTNILTTEGSFLDFNGTFGGWALSVAYDNNAKKFKRVTLFDGFGLLDDSNKSDSLTFRYPIPLIDGFETNRSGDVNASLILFASEGDKDSLGDIIAINGKNGSSYFNSNDPLNSNVGLNISNFDLTNEINNSENEANISLNMEVNTTIKEADNYFLGFIGLSTELGEDVCYETTVKKVGATSFDTFANLGEVREADELIFKVNATNRGFYSNYLAINKFLEENSSLNFECICGSDGTCIIPTPDYADITSNDTNLTFKLGSGANLNSGGFLSKGTTSSDIYFKAKVGFYKNGHSYLFDYNKYRYRDRNITTLEHIGYCSSKPKLNFEDLSLSITSEFIPNQIFKNEMSSFDLNVTVENLSSFSAHDLNVTIDFSDLLNFGKTLSDLNPIPTYNSNDWNYTIVNNYTLRFQLKNDINLSKNTPTTFIIDLNTTFNKSGVLQATSTITSTMQEANSSTAYLSIAELIAEYKFDECFWGNDGNSFNMVVVDSESGDYNATAMNEANTTDIESKVCRSGDFSKNSIADYVSLDNNILNGERDFTITAWVNVPDINNQTLISGAKSNSDNKLLLRINKTHIRTFISNKYKNFIYNVSNNNWHYIAWSKFNTNNCIYVDNSLIGCQEINDNQNLEINKLVIGQRIRNINNDTFDHNFQGYIDEVKIYKGTLTAENINAIYSSEVNPSRSCPICYPKKYEFISDGNGTCGDTNGEEITLNLLNEDNSSFVFIDSSSANYQDKYPTLNYFDLNITTNAKEANITNLAFQVISSNTLPSIVRANSPSSGTFIFNNPCKNSNGNRCSEALDVNFSVNNILQSPVVGDYTIQNDGFLNYSLVTRMMYFKVGGINYNNYPKEVVQEVDEPLMDSLGQTYNFYMEFNESDTGKAINLTGVTDSSYYQNLIESGFSTTIDSLADTQSGTQNISFTTPSNKLGLSTATIKVENSNNFCADGTYSVEVLTKPSMFEVTLDSRIFDLVENNPSPQTATLKYDKNLTLNIIPICNNGECVNNLKNLSNFLGSNKTTYFTEINATDTTNGNAIDIEVNQSVGSGTSYHKTEWGSDGNFTKLYFENNNLDSALYYNDTNNQFVDLNFTLSYFRLFNRDGSLYGNSKYGYAVYGNGISTKFVKGPDHIRVGYNEGEQKCGREFYLTLYPEDEANATVEWGGYQIEIVLNDNIFWVDGYGWSKNGNTNTYSFTTNEGNDSYINANIISKTETCCPNSTLEISNIILKDSGGAIVADFDNTNGVYKNNPEKNYFYLSCPAYSFLAFEDNNTISPTLDDNNISGTDRNITTKIANNSLSFILVSYWDENETLIDFPIKVRTSIINRNNSDNVVYPQNPPSYYDILTLIDSSTNIIGRNTWSITNTAFGNSAYRYLAVRIVEDGNDSNFNISDPFAIRPNNFNLAITSNSARAGEDFNMNLSALDISGATINNYSESENTNRSFKIDVNLTHDGVFNQTDLSLNDDFNYTDEGTLTFTSGEILNLSTAILEVGNFEINITDGDGNYENSPTDCSSCSSGSSCISTLGCPYACIDITDNSCSGLSIIENAKDTITITPYQYAIAKYSFNLFPNNFSNWIYMADMNDLYLEVNATIQAQNILSNPTQNFTSSIFDGSLNPIINVNADINLSINNPSNQEFDVNGTKIDAINTNIANSKLNSGNDDNLTPFFNLSSNNHFTDGNATISYKFNLYKNSNNPLNPIQFILHDINTTNSCIYSCPSDFTSGINIGVLDDINNTSFYYGRVATPIDTELDVTNITNKNFEFKVEVYMQDSSYDFISLRGNANSYIINWYQNNSDTISRIKMIRAMKDTTTYDSNIKIENISNTDINSSTISPNKLIFGNNGAGSTILNIDFNALNNNDFPYTTKFFLDVEKYLWFDNTSPYSYNGDSNNTLKQPNFTITFKQDSVGGKGVNENLRPSGMTKRRLDW